MKNPLLKQIGGATLAKIGQAGFGLILALVLARTFGADSFGVYVYVTSTATLMAIFTRFGFHVHVIYAINLAIAENRSHEVGTILLTAALVTTSLSMLAGLGLYGIASLFPHWAMSHALSYSAALVTLTALVHVASGAMQALGRVVLGVSLEGIIKPVLLLAAIGTSLVFATPETLGYEGMLNAFVASQTILVIGSVGAVIYWIKRDPGGFTFYPKLMKSHISESFPFLLTNAMSSLYQYSGIVTVGLFFTPAAVALFRIAEQLSALIPFGLQALQVVLRPRIARMYAGGMAARIELQTLITRSIRILAIAQSPIMIATIFFPYFLVLLFSKEFLNASPLLTILAIGQCYSIFAGLNSDVLNMTGNSGVAAKWSFIAFLMVIILMWPFIRLWGPLGAALAICCSRILWNTALVVSAARETGLHTTIFGVLPISQRKEDVR